MYITHKDNPEKHDRLFCNAPVAILVIAHNELNGALASSNMDLMVDALGLSTFYNGFFQVAAQDNKAISDFLGLKDEKRIVSCMDGYPAVQYKRTVPRKDAEITWI